MLCPKCAAENPDDATRCAKCSDSLSVAVLEVIRGEVPEKIRFLKPRSAPVICMMASVTCSSTGLSTSVALSVCTSCSSNCCCSTHGSLAIAPVALSLPSGENLSVTLPSWTWAPGVSSARRTLAALT